MKIVNVKKSGLKVRINKVFKKYRSMGTELKAKFQKLYPDAESRKPLYVYDSKENKVKVLPVTFKGVMYYVVYPLIVLKRKIRIVAQNQLAKGKERRKLKIGK